MLTSFVIWYLVIQLISFTALPLTRRLFVALPDSGYAFAKSLGVFGVGVTLWLGTSYGILINDRGGAWLAFLLFAIASHAVGVSHGHKLLPWRKAGLDGKQIATAELLFLMAYVAWGIVRIHDPAANHTEQPMDLMFMNSIWSSPSFPPQDAWLSGYAISYYYLGYWILTTLGHLSASPPEIAYNLGQASWFGLLLLGSYGVVSNLLAAVRIAASPVGTDRPVSEPRPVRIRISDRLGGLLGALVVGVAGNLQIVLELLHANGVRINGLVELVDVHNFPGNAPVTGEWYVGYDWWWWRSSRVIQDMDLLDQHIEVINEFPIFSYILGDNHPHVIAMPIAILAIGMALNIFLASAYSQRPRLVLDLSRKGWDRFLGFIPLRTVGFLAVVAVTGGLIFLNTWDFPPYWLLLAGAYFLASLPSLSRQVNNSGPPTIRAAFVGAALFAGLILLGAILLYLPYFLTAQSQAGGFLPNLLNPTRFAQFVLMFGAFLPALLALILYGWTGDGRPHAKTLGVSAGLTYGIPALFLLVSVAIATGTNRGTAALSRMPLPEGADSYLPFIVERWRSQPFTFLVVGGMLSLVLAMLWRRMIDVARRQPTDTLSFALLLAAVGLGLVYAPEFIYLRDNFGTRMNTVFKFYYQAWLILGLTCAFAIVEILRSAPRRRNAVAVVLSSVSLLVFGLVMFYPIAGVYGKTLGFSTQAPTLDASAYIALEQPNEWAAIQWFRTHTPANARIMEGKGASYWATYNRISTLTGRPTLLGWDGHEAQWRGRSYGEMAAGRVEALDTVYRIGSPQEIRKTLEDWDIQYVYVGPTERSQYGITPQVEARLSAVLEPVFEQGNVRVYAAMRPFHEQR